MKLLLVEDDLEFAQLIEEFLNTRGISTFICDDPFKALVQDLKKFDLVLLDLGLPGIDGLELCKEFRKKSLIPIIISSARSAVSDKVTALQLGADDYLPKPYDPDELYARVISQVRRYKGDFGIKKEEKNFINDEKIRDVFFKDKQLYLTEAEYEIFSTLIKNSNAIVSKEQLLGSCPSIQSRDGNSLEAIISKIRQKIKLHSQENYIIASRGKGYRVVQ